MPYRLQLICSGYSFHTDAYAYPRAVALSQGGADGAHGQAQHKRAAAVDGEQEDELRVQKRRKVSATTASDGSQNVRNSQESGVGEERSIEDAGLSGARSAEPPGQNRKSGRRTAGWLRKKLRKKAGHDHDARTAG